MKITTAGVRSVSGRRKNTKAKGSRSDWQVRQDAGRSTILRKIHMQLVCNDDSTGVFNATVTQWQDKHGMVYYTARKASKAYSDEQKCEYWREEGTKYKVITTDSSGIWHILSDANTHKNRGNSRKLQSQEKDVDFSSLF